MLSVATVTNAYRKNKERYEQKENIATAKLKNLGWARVIVAVALISIFLFETVRNWSGTPYLIILLIVAFFALVKLYGREKDNIAYNKTFKDLNADSLNRVSGDWTDVNAARMNALKSQKPFNHVFQDMNIAGDVSLLDYICTLYTSKGFDTLYSWLEHPQPKSLVVERQQAIRELSDQLEHRHDVQAHLALTLSDHAKTKQEINYNKIIDWASAPNEEALTPFPIKIVRLFSLLFSLSLALFLLIAPKYIALSVLFLVGNIILMALSQKKIVNVFNQTSYMDRELKSYSFLCQVLVEKKFKAKKLKALQTKVGADNEGQEAHIALSKLSDIIAWSDLRYSGLIHILANFAFLYDLHVYAVMTHWKQTYGKNIENWIEACGDYEVLMSLSEIAANNPDWCFPKMSEGSASSIIAKTIGHPLIKTEERVYNDVEVGPEGNFLLITGSNMSGKSTLLRTIGVNVILARTGAPVCASEFETPSVDIATSFRITDNLSEGVSLFMAELKQIKQIIDLVKTNSTQNILTLFLLDEILQGTNSKERHIAVVTILAELLDQKCIGAISTHDLDLASSKQIKQSCHPIYFKDEIIKQGENVIMRFDYKLRHGVASTQNALTLLEAVGIKTGSALNIKIEKPRL